jgi:hypothetical protein
MLIAMLLALAAQDKPAGPEALRAEVEALRPPRVVWRDIAWKSCPLEALKEAREKNRPIITWVFLGSPVDERC